MNEDKTLKCLRKVKHIRHLWHRCFVTVNHVMLLRQAILLLGWSHLHKYYSVVITIWLTAMKYPFLKWQWIWFLRRCLLTSMTAKTITGLGCIYHLYSQLFVRGCVFYLCYFYLSTYCGVKHVLTMRETWCLFYKHELLTLRNPLGSPLVFGWVRVAHLFNFLCCDICCCIICLHPVSCVPNVASVSGFSRLFW